MKIYTLNIIPPPPRTPDIHVLYRNSCNISHPMKFKYQPLIVHSSLIKIRNIPQQNKPQFVQESKLQKLNPMWWIYHVKFIWVFSKIVEKWSKITLILYDCQLDRKLMIHSEDSASSFLCQKQNIFWSLLIIFRLIKYFQKYLYHMCQNLLITCH